MSLDFVDPPMVTPELIHLNLGPLKELHKHGRKRVNNVDLLRARALTRPLLKFSKNNEKSARARKSKANFVACLIRYRYFNTTD